VLASFVIASCGSSTKSSVPSNVPVSTVAPTTAKPTEKVAVLAYFLLNEKLHAVGREVASADSSAAVTALLAGPTNEEKTTGLVTLIPAGTTLNGVKLNGREAVIDLSAAYGSGGGTLSVTGRVAQMVFTLTQFPGVDTVRFSLDGKSITELTGEGFSVDGMSRSVFADMTPLVLLEHPYAGQTVTQPIRIAGMSNTFEASVYYEVLATNGTKLIDGFVMATSGTGTWGTFDAELRALPAGTKGPVTLRVFDLSAENGDPTSVTEVRIQL
jgi:hypothetical protein